MNSQEWQIEEEEDMRNLGLKASAKLLELEPDDSLFCSTRELVRGQHSLHQQRRSRYADTLTPWHICNPRAVNGEDLRSSGTEIPLQKTMRSPPNLCHQPASNHLVRSPKKSSFLVPLEIPKRPLHGPLEFQPKISETSKIVLSALGLMYQSPKINAPEKQSARKPCADTFSGGTEKEPHHFSPSPEVNKSKEFVPVIHRDLNSNKHFLPPALLKPRKQQTLLHFPPPGYLRSPAQQIFSKELHRPERDQQPDKGHEMTSHQPDHGHGMTMHLPHIHLMRTSSTAERTRMVGSTCDLPRLLQSTSKPECEPAKKRKAKGHAKRKDDALDKTLTTVDISSAVERPPTSETERLPPLSLLQPAAGHLREEPEDRCEEKLIQVCMKQPPVSGMGAGDCTPEEDAVWPNVTGNTSTPLTPQTPKTNEEDFVCPTTLLGVKPSLTSAVDKDNSSVEVKQKRKQPHRLQLSLSEKGASLSSSGITLPSPSGTPQKLTVDEVQTPTRAQAGQLDQSSPINSAAVRRSSGTGHNFQLTGQEAAGSSPPYSERDLKRYRPVIALIISSQLASSVHEPDRTDEDRSSERRAVDAIIPKRHGNGRKTLGRSVGKGDAESDLNLSGGGANDNPTTLSLNKLSNLTQRTSHFYCSSETSNSQRTDIAEPPKKSSSKQVIFPSRVSAAYGAKVLPSVKETPPADKPHTASCHADQKLRSKRKFVISGMTKIYGGQREPTVAPSSRILPPGENVASDSTMTLTQNSRGNSRTRYQAVVRNFVRKFKVLRSKENSRNSGRAIRRSQAAERTSKVQHQKTFSPILAPGSAGLFKDVDILSPEHTPDTLSKILKGDEPQELGASPRRYGSSNFRNKHCRAGLNQRQTVCCDLNFNHGSVKKTQAFNERKSLSSADTRRQTGCTKQITKKTLQKNKGRVSSSTRHIPKLTPPEPSNSEVRSKPAADFAQDVVVQNVSHNACAVDRGRTVGKPPERSDILSFNEPFPPPASSDDNQPSRLVPLLPAIAPTFRSARNQLALNKDGRFKRGTTASLIRRARYDRQERAKGEKSAKRQLKGVGKKKSTPCVPPSPFCDSRSCPGQSHGSRDAPRSVPNDDIDVCTHRLDVVVPPLAASEGPCGKETDFTTSQPTDDACGAGQQLPVSIGWQLKESLPQSLQVHEMGACSYDASVDATTTVSEVLNDMETLRHPLSVGNKQQALPTTVPARKSLRRPQTLPGDSERKQSQASTSENHARGSPRRRRVFHKDDNNSAKKQPQRGWRLPPGSVAEFIFLSSHLPGITSLNAPVHRRLPTKSRRSDE